MEAQSLDESSGASHRPSLMTGLLFESAQRQGFLKIPVTGIRPNVVNVYRLWCAAEGRDFSVNGGPEFPC
jgi:hypothetical protein